MTVRAADNVEVWQRRIQKLRGVHLNLSLSLNNSNNSPTISCVSACYHLDIRLGKDETWNRTP
jgi:hypothetical protein